MGVRRGRSWGRGRRGEGCGGGWGGCGGEWCSEVGAVKDGAAGYRQRRGWCGGGWGGEGCGRGWGGCGVGEDELGGGG